jgi:sugar O-acyltransferase (sialic acid O-acetyltransferase NeuD family)
VRERFLPSGDVSVFVAMGYSNMRARARLHGEVKRAGYRLANLICPGAHVAKDVTMGDNNIVMPGAVVEPGVALGANNVVWSNATLCHDGRIGDHNFIAANVTLGGNVTAGARNFIGFSAVVLQGRRIGDDTLIGAQSLVNRDTQDLSMYLGSPARRVRSLDPAVGVAVGDA